MIRILHRQGSIASAYLPNESALQGFPFHKGTRSEMGSLREYSEGCYVAFGLVSRDFSSLNYNVEDPGLCYLL